MMRGRLWGQSAHRLVAAMAQATAVWKADSTDIVTAGKMVALLAVSTVQLLVALMAGCGVESLAGS